MISAIPDQPITLNDTRLQGCVCEGPSRCLLALPDDVLKVQIAGTLCNSAPELLGNPGFASTADWTYGAWVSGAGTACISASSAGPPLKLVETSFNPTVGSVYVVYFQVVDFVSGPMIVTFGGNVLSNSIDADGAYTFVVTALTTEGLIFSNVVATLALCLDYASVKELNTDLIVSLVDSAGSVVDDFDYATFPDRFAYDRDHVTITLPLAEMMYNGVPNGCYTITIEDPCDNVTLESQCISINDHTCTLLLTACSTNDTGGIYFADYSHTIRVNAKLVRATFEYQVKEERLSNGYIDRYWADRQRVMELRIGRIDWRGHDCLSSFTLMDHFYVDGDEYVIDAEPFEPAYGDVYDDQGDVLVKVRPKQELMRKVRCGDDDGGCAPPPNYLVQRSGPNSDYVLQTDGERILIY